MEGNGGGAANGAKAPQLLTLIVSSGWPMTVPMILEMLEVATW